MEIVKKRRQALETFFAAMGRRSRNAICKGSKVSESAVRGFLAGRSASLEETTYERLSAYTGWPIAAIKGDEPPPDRNKLAQKNDKSDSNFNDLATLLREDEPRTDRSGSPESEGQMLHQLRLDIVDRIWELPSEHLASLKKHIDAIERATEKTPAHPQQRATAE